MKNTFLVTRPNHDKTTNYLSHWANEVIRQANSLGIKTLDLMGKKACRETLESYLTKSPKLLFLNGHGSKESISGHGNEPILECGKKNSLPRDSIVYALSCHAAAKLGKELTEQEKNRAFIGYEEQFGFVHSASREATPHKDRIPHPFKEASNVVPLSLLKGNNAETAFEKSQKTFLEGIRKHAVSESRPENKEIRFWLFWDMTFQRLMGKKENRFI